MYAVSSVNEGKYRVLADSLARAFKGAPRSMEPIQIGKPAKGGNEASVRNAPLNNAIVDPGARAAPRDPVRAKGVDARQQLTELKRLQAERAAHREAAQQAQLARIASEVEQALAGLLAEDLIIVRRTEFWLEIEIRSDMLFASGSAELEPAAREAIDRLAEILSRFPNPIRVEGHTDDRPISTSVYPSNWELSAARAATVVKRMAEHGVSPTRMSVLGFGEWHPVAPNDTEEGRRRNRRVTVVVLAEVGEQRVAESRAVDVLRAASIDGEAP